MCQAQIKACQMGIPFPQEQRQTVMMKIKLMRILLLIWTKKKNDKTGEERNVIFSPSTNDVADKVFMRLEDQKSLTHKKA